MNSNILATVTGRTELKVRDFRISRSTMPPKRKPAAQKSSGSTKRSRAEHLNGSDVESLENDNTDNGRLVQVSVDVHEQPRSLRSRGNSGAQLPPQPATSRRGGHQRPPPSSALRSVHSHRDDASQLVDASRRPPPTSALWFQTSQLGGNYRQPTSTSGVSQRGGLQEPPLRLPRPIVYQHEDPDLIQRASSVVVPPRPPQLPPAATSVQSSAGDFLGFESPEIQDTFSRFRALESQFPNTHVSAAPSNAVPIQPQPHIDPLTRLSNVLEATFLQIQNSSAQNTAFMNKLTSSRSLPIFSGDPLEWRRFFQAYQFSNQASQISDAENISRLYEALKGEARETVKTLFASGSSPQEIMRILELRYGNTKIILEKIMFEFQNLPAIDSGKISLLDFASKLKNSVTAIKSLNNFGYLYSPQLYDEIIKKLPKALLFNYIRYAQLTDQNLSDLEKVSEFLYQEAHMALTAGITDVYLVDQKPRKIEPFSVKKRSVLATSTVTSESQHQSLDSKHQKKGCEICNRSNHEAGKCEKLLRESSKDRWRLVRKRKLCFKCLKSGHNRNDCSATVCSVCQRNHHSSLHFTENSKPTNATQQRSLTGLTPSGSQSLSTSSSSKD